MSNNVNTVNQKVVVTVAIVGLLTAIFLVYNASWLPTIDPTELSGENYYYHPNVPQEDQRVVCIVFDDGWLTQYTNARPVLDKYGFKATFAIVTSYPNRLLGYMDWNKIVALHNQGHDIESHSVNHFPLKSNDMETVEYQLSQSKQDLLTHGIIASLFVYPHGEGAGDIAIEKVVQQYYYAACGINQSNFDMSQPFNQYALPSYAIGNSTTMEMFKNYVNQANSSTIVIIHYYQISDGAVSTSVTSEDFAAQMQYLYDNNFSVQTLKQLLISTTP